MMLLRCSHNISNHHRLFLRFTCNTTTLLCFKAINLQNIVHSSTFHSFQGFSFRAVTKRIASHLGTSSHVISHAFCLCSCAAHACWDNKLGASLLSWQHHFAKKSGGIPSFYQYPSPHSSADSMQTYGAAADWSNMGLFICFHQADTVHEPQVD